jgi:hypothetical protein
MEDIMTWFSCEVTFAETSIIYTKLRHNRELAGWSVSNCTTANHGLQLLFEAGQR